MRIDIQETGPMPVNTYILKDEKSKEAVIIDIGGEFGRIKKTLESEGFKLKYILLTHGHYDHVLGLADVKKISPELPVYMHKADMPHIKNIKEEMHYFGSSFNDEEITITGFIDENSELFIGDNKIKVLYTPGHTAGGLSFYTGREVFAGDALFYRSIGRTDFYDSSFEQLINSIKTKLFTLPDDTVIYPGHGCSSKIGSEKKYNEFLKL